MSEPRKPMIPDSWLPWLFVVFFAVILIPNGILVYAALQSWTGVESEQHYIRGLKYNETLDDVAQQEARGWRAGLSVQSRNRDTVDVRLTLTDRQKNPISGARATVRFVRPTHEGHDFELTLQDFGGGRYQGAAALPMAGQWDVRVTAAHRAGTYRLTQRVVLP